MTILEVSEGPDLDMGQALMYFKVLESVFKHLLFSSICCFQAFAVLKHYADT